MEYRPVIELFTDGAASGNPGPGGYGVVLRCMNVTKELSGGFRRTTNNRMELLAVIKGLEAIRWDNARVVVTSDSNYVVKAINEKWLDSWIKKDFKKVKNPDLWRMLIPLLQRHRVSFQWIKGHDRHPENERCDSLAVTACHQQDLPADEAFENQITTEQETIWDTTENQ